MAQSFFDGTSRTGHSLSFMNVLVCTGKPDTRVCQDGFARSCPAPEGEWMYGNHTGRFRAGAVAAA